ncbi:MAG: thioredoxin domain-containing protein [Candidatus Magnetominusculus sp. LBB02]|nr:thioredoxin domain-containing protein [Candidatus Magnetominusculus sp. LBB02]
MAKNRLINEKSPYLLQHAENPVNWYPWSDEAFEAARTEDKPIFLSIGYSTCHWCHVMSHESFEDAEVSSLMNDAFISIKLDREERPDIDNIYMAACQMITGGGGWPLTIIMFPDGRPFFAATYIPKHNRGSSFGMVTLIPHVKRAWQSRRGELTAMADQITKQIQEHASTTDADGRHNVNEIMDKTYNALLNLFDSANGGFGGAPKFPTPHNILFLLRYYFETGKDAALDMAEITLTAMRMGGIYDHIGYAFHRYSTDAAWHVPHFEKMLYDQALLLIAYTEAFAVTSDEFYRRTAYEIIEYAFRDMRNGQGAFYTAIDADSGGVEGQFYLWTYEQLIEALTPGEAEAFISVFGLGTNDANQIPHMAMPEDEIPDDKRRLINSALVTLRHARNKRVHPDIDDKILTDLNGLMAAALAIAGRTFNDESLLSAASTCLDFIDQSLAAADELGLLHRYREGQSAVMGTINDYASVIWALIELYQSSFDEKYLVAANKRMDYMIEHFWDFGAGGFYFTDKDSEALIARQKDLYDGAVPSGNSIALHNMMRLARITGNYQLQDKAHQMIDSFYSQALNHPQAYTFFAAAAGQAVKTEAVIAGQEQEARAILRTLGQTYLPGTVFVLKADHSKSIIPYTEDMKAINGKPAIYICTAGTCHVPLTEIGDALKLLKA